VVVRIVSLIRVPLSIEWRRVVVARFVAWRGVTVSVPIIGSLALLALLSSAELGNYASADIEI